MYNNPSSRYAQERTSEDLEGQNEEALEGLSQKVKLLKNVRLRGNVVRLRGGRGVRLLILIRTPRLHADHDQHWQRGPGLDQDAERHGASFFSLEGALAYLRFLPDCRCPSFGRSSLTLSLPRLTQNDTFGETGTYLSGTMKKMRKMAKRQGGQWCLCALLILTALPLFGYRD